MFRTERDTSAKFFSSPRLALRARVVLRAKYLVRPAWLIKRLTCRLSIHREWERHKSMIWLVKLGQIIMLHGTCGTPGTHNKYSSLPNANVKFPVMRFWRRPRKPAAVNFSLAAFTWRLFVEINVKAHFVHQRIIKHQLQTLFGKSAKVVACFSLCKIPNLKTKIASRLPGNQNQNSLEG